jgi:glycosyltransferase involved in cell wall biosynthesis
VLRVAAWRLGATAVSWEFPRRGTPGRCRRTLADVSGRIIHRLKAARTHVGRSNGGGRPKDRVGVLFMQSQTYFGSDSLIHSLIMGNLDRERFEVHAAVNRGTVFDPSASLPALRAAVPDLHIRPTSFGTSINFRSWREKVRDTLVYGPRSLCSLVGLAWYARRHHIDIIHGTEKPRDAFYGYLIAKASGAKTVVHLHVGVNHDWMLGLTQFAMRHADCLLGVSEFVKQSAIDAGYRPDRCYAVVNAIDATNWDPTTDGQAVRDEFAIPSDAVVLSIISRVCIWKGHTELLHALAKVTVEFDNFRLLLVGEDDIRAHPGNTSYIAELRELVGELGLEDKVIFTGFRRDVRNLLAASDIYAMPSFEEPCAVAFLEALAMATPVVALDSGGTKQLVDQGQSGLLSEPYDIDQLSANLLGLMQDPDRRKAMGDHARARVLEYYTPRRIAADVEVVYDDILTG